MHDKLRVFDPSSVLPGGQFVVTAGAGAGKTRALVDTVEHLVNAHNLAPKKLAVVTYTKSAADVLVERLRARGISGALVGTIHHLARLSIAQQQEFRSLRFPSPESYMSIIVKTASESGLSWSTDIATDLMTLMTYHVASGAGPESWTPDVPLPVGVSRTSAIEVLTKAREESARSGRIYPDDQLVLASALPRLDVDFVLVDEAQDLTPRQWYLIQHWADHGGTLLVGDPMQAIFGFAGAQHQIMVEAPGERFHLPYNYRSTANIIDLSNRLRTDELICHPPDSRDPGPKVELIPFSHPKEVHAKVTDGYVLARTNKELRGYREGSTIHQAKGGEWDSIDVIGFGDKFPHPKSDLDTERRILYVAVTRAKRCLRIHYKEGYDSELLEAIRE